MLEHCKSARERWGGVSEIIDRWLNGRQNLLVEYCYLSDRIEDLDNETCGEKIVELCQNLVDYISAGHFEIYDQLIKEGVEFDDKPGLKAASSLFKQVDQSTETILEFNDKYQEVDDLDAIENDLSRLGETLATRFEAEDAMIEVLHYAHQDAAEQSA